MYQQVVRTHARNSSLDRSGGAFADFHHGDHGRHPDDDSEGR
jgi:hypothetical protein